MKQLLYLLLAVGVFLLDRITKWLIITSRITIQQVTPWLSWYVHYNRGVSWSFLHAKNTSVFVLVSLIVLAITMMVAVYAYDQWQQDKMIWGQLLIIAGSLSNVVDRFVYSGVVDFIYMHIHDWSFAIFNIADVAIVLGVCIMIAQEVYYQHA